MLAEIFILRLERRCGRAANRGPFPLLNMCPSIRLCLLASRCGHQGSAPDAPGPAGDTLALYCDALDEIMQEALEQV